VEAAVATATSSTATVRSRAKARPLRERLSREQRQPKARQLRRIGRVVIAPTDIVLRATARKEIVRRVIVRKATARPAGIIATTTIAATKAVVSARVARVPRAAMTGLASAPAVREIAQLIAPAVSASSRRQRPRAASARNSPIPIHPSQNCWRSSSSLKVRDRETRRAAIEPRAAPA
jgi:hypothetical protein